MKQDEAVQALEMSRETNLSYLNTQLLEHRAVLPHISLERENTDQRGVTTSHALQAGEAPGDR